MLYLWRMKRILFLLLLTVMLFSCGDTTTKDDQPLRVATAANLQYAIDPLVAAFEKANDQKVEIILGSSGKLSAQIIESAPYDIFLAADQTYPKTIADQSLTLNKPQTYARGELVLWTTSIDSTLDLTILDLSKINHFAIANPAIAPYGKAAEAALKHYGWFEQLSKKLVLGESIAQTNQFIMNGNAELGFTSRSSLMGSPLQGKGTWTTLNEKSYPSIRQDLVVLKKAKERGMDKAAWSFVKFLHSPTAQEILIQHGYQLP